MENPAYHADQQGSGAIAQGERPTAGGEGSANFGGNFYGPVTVLMGSETNRAGYIPKHHLAMHPPPLHYSVLFDRDPQDARLQSALESRPPMLTVVLPGPTNEEPEDYTERFAIFTLRKFCRNQGLPYSLDRKILEWPSPDRTNEERYRDLLADVGAMIGKPRQGEPELRNDLAQWLHEGRQHKVLIYNLFFNKCRGKDADLIARWSEFWNGLDYRSDQYLVTVFFCLYFRTSWYARTFGQAASCLRALRKRVPDAGNFVLAPPLAQGCEDEVESWAGQCFHAWGLENSADPCPLDKDSLKREARAAFNPRKKRPFSDLKDDLKKAITQADKRRPKTEGER